MEFVHWLERLQSSSAQESMTRAPGPKDLSRSRLGRRRSEQGKIAEGRKWEGIAETSDVRG